MGLCHGPGGAAQQSHNPTSSDSWCLCPMTAHAAPRRGELHFSASGQLVSAIKMKTRQCLRSLRQQGPSLVLNSRLRSSQNFFPALPYSLLTEPLQQCLLHVPVATGPGEVQDMLHYLISSSLSPTPNPALRNGTSNPQQVTKHRDHHCLNDGFRHQNYSGAKLLGRGPGVRRKLLLSRKPPAHRTLLSSKHRSFTLNKQI